ncbi:MAG: CPBP family glutamic-type intramembrane protease, partial [Thermoanaerobaculia bacterium]
VFRSFILGYTLVAFFLAYQVVFYIVAARFGAWAPADVPYDDMLNTAFPWIAVLFAGFFPALSEEFLSRAFSIPFLDRLLRNRVAAIVLSGFIWGFGHATYPNQPFYIRGVEVGMAGVLIGFLFNRFGLLPLLIWHYTVDAVYTALLLFRSNNLYYVVSAAISSLIFAIPMLVSIALYIRNRGFIPDDDLTNASMPVIPEPAAAEAEPSAVLPPARPVTKRQLALFAIAVIVVIVVAASRPASPDDVIDYRIDRARAKEIATATITGTMHQPQMERTIAATTEGFRSWDANSRREDGGSPDGFDAVAASYLLRDGVRMRGLVDVFRNRIQAATWSVRSFTPMRREELFVEIDPRTARTIGFHKYQSEKNPGPRLEQAAALDIARRAFTTFGVDATAFDLKEALSFQQPNRRDWLFHFEERKAIAAQAYRRISIRVAGAETTQFATTVKIPDSVYRDEGSETLLNVVFTILKIIGTLTALALVVSGFVMATRKGSLQWRRPLRWTLFLAIIPIVLALAGYESHLFGYSTSISWQTFTADLTVSLVREVALKIVIIFLALAAIETAVPFAWQLVSPEGRRRFGRSAVMSAVTAIAVVGTVRAALAAISTMFPRAAMLRGFNVPPSVEVAVPSLIDLAQALYTTLITSGAVAMAAVGIASFPRKRGLTAAIVLTVIFCATLDPGATMAETPLMLLRAAVMAATLWLVARFVLNGNILAWPLAIFTAELLPSAIFLLQNHRTDLRAHAIVEIALVAAVLIWSAAATPPLSHDEQS